MDSETYGPKLNTDELLPLEPQCPWCHEDHDVGETFGGRDHDCANCGKRIVAVAYSSEEGDYMAMERCGDLHRRPADHKATRARWKRQGRRG